jgi:hypothetical protein
MFFYILLYSSLFVFSYNNMIYYNGVIQLNIKPNPFIIKKDLNIVEQYKKEAGIHNKLGAPVISNLSENSQKNGLSLYEHNKNPYQELHYIVAKKLLETNMQGIEGIFAHYRGYSVMSDINGNIILPRLDDTNLISIVITQNIQPIIIHGSIPDHFIIEHNSKYASYVAEKIEVDPNLSIMKWSVKPNPTLIINQKIPYPTIVIIADPDLFFFDNNPLSSDSSINVLLPTLYATTENSSSNYSNLAMQTLQYFKQIQETKYTTEIENQLHEGKILK